MNFLNSLLLLFFLLPISLLAQHDCGTTSLEQFTTVDFVKKQQSQPTHFQSESIIEIPIQIHIIGANNGLFAIDSQVVLNELEIVNEAFADANIVFTLCNDINFIYDNTYVTFIKNQSETLCDAEDYPNVINIYFAPNIEKDNGDDLCGYAYNFDIKQRVFMDNGCADNGSTFTHEMGHSLSLLHTHSTSNGDELVSGTNCATAGDLLCDTPADPRLSSDIVNENCEYTGTAIDNQQNTYDPSTINLMSYSRKSCRTEFTQEQLLQMEAYYLAEGSVLECTELSTSNNNISDFKSIEVFPNPTSSSLFVENIPTNSKLEIWNVNGQLLKSLNSLSNTTQTQITAFEKFPKGIYYLKIISLDDFYSKKIIKN